MTAAERETILIIEDDDAIREGLLLNLRVEGYQVLSAADARRGLELARESGPDLILLDLMLPDGSGLDLLKKLRSEDREMHVLILTARGMEEDKVRGLNLGADDYITKPFSLGELLARINAALRRTRGSPGRRAFGEIVLDLATREVQRGGEPVKLTRREFELLGFLVEHPDRVYSRDQLLEMVWGIEYQGTARTVDNFISSLRSKLEDNPGRPRHITTVHGVGYRLRM